MYAPDSDKAEAMQGKQDNIAMQMKPYCLIDVTNMLTMKRMVKQLLLL